MDVGAMEVDDRQRAGTSRVVTATGRQSGWGE